jgi:hypothetical protein
MCRECSSWALDDPDSAPRFIEAGDRAAPEALPEIRRLAEKWSFD